MLRFRATVVIVGIAVASPIAAADSIQVGDKTYTDVYIDASNSFYYIRDPADGSTEAVSKLLVSPAEVIFARPAERTRLLRAWEKAKAAAMAPPEPVAPAKPAAPEIDPVRVNAPQLTNVPEKLAKRRKGRRLYLDGDGVGVLTNRPGKFEGDRDYVEVLIHYDPIVVPAKLREHVRSQRGGVKTGIDEIVEYYAGQYDLDPNLVYAVIKVESNGNPNAVSRAGARGLMQLMPPTAADMGVSDIFDPAENIAGGTQYLAKMHELFGGDTVKMLAAYNAGPGRVKQYGGVPPYTETRNYVRRVLQYRQQYARTGTPTFDVSGARLVAADYLPPESAKYYRIKLFNGLTLSAEGVRDEGDHYLYAFEGRSGTIPKDRVSVIYEPVEAD